MSARIGLVGGAGFIGTGLARAALAMGYRVSVLDPQPSLVPGVQYSNCELSDASALKEWMSDVDVVVLLAGLLSGPALRQPREAWATNVVGCTMALDAAICAGVERVILLSSAAVYARDAEARALSEVAPTAPVGLYGTAKLSLEYAVRAAVAAGLPAALILRPFTVFGHGPMRGERGHFIGRWLELALAGEALAIHGDGRQPVDLVQLETVSAICLRFVSEVAPPPLRILNATGGAPLSVVELAAIFQQAHPGIRARHVPPAETAPLHGWGDPHAMSAYLGQMPPPPRAAIRAFLDEKFK